MRTAPNIRKCPRGLGSRRLAAVLLLATLCMSACTSGNNEHAEVVALDAATGRVSWSSGDLSDLASVGMIRVDDAAVSVAVLGMTCSDDGKVLTAVLDLSTGKLQS